MDPLAAEVRRERSRLALREVQAAHRLLDEQEAAAAQEEQDRLDVERRREQEREQARLDALSETRERLRRAAETKRERDRHAGVLALVLGDVIERYTPPYGVTIPQALTERAVAEIQRFAGSLPFDAVLFLRVRDGALRIRDRLFGPEIQKQEERRRRQPDLVRSGLVYAQGEIEARGSLALRQWPALYTRLNDELPKRLTGDETEEQVEDLIDGLLRRAGRPG
ncbi:MAG: hypothetical protein ACHQ7N_13515 [Candidatus Methylomirabilales bacterium]